MIGQEPSGAPPAGLFELTPFSFTASRGLAEWLGEQDMSLAFTTGARLMLVGADADGRLAVTEHAFEAPSGLAAAGSSMYVAARWQLWRLENALAPGERDPAGHDRLYLPQSAWTTGFLGAYDVALEGPDRPLFASALCNCVATVAHRLSFTAVWRPPFISALIAEDRCHLTGLELVDGELAYVTCCAATDTREGWIPELRSGGVVVDARSDEIVAAGLSLPHSPRRHEGRLYVAEAGTGRLLLVDPATGATETVASVPGLARGLSLIGGTAVVGCSRVLADGQYADAPVGRLSPGAQRHGLMVVDLASGELLHELVLEGASGEVFAVAAVRGSRYVSLRETPGGVREPLAIGPAPHHPSIVPPAPPQESTHEPPSS